MNITKDLSTLTTIPVNVLDKLVEKSVYCICHQVNEDNLNNETITTVDFGIGILYIKIEEEEIKYKFIPSKLLEESLKTTILEGESPLINELEDTLKEKIINTYKDLF